jgi:hypothetical protein
MTHEPLSRSPIVTSRVRRIDGQSFAFIHHRFLRDGFFVHLSPSELRLYLFLVLAADRNGMSFYHDDRICAVLEVGVDDYLDARNGLIDKDLVAFDGSRFQVLSLPERPRRVRSRRLRSQADLNDNDPATVRRTILASLAHADDLDAR